MPLIIQNMLLSASNTLSYHCINALPIICTNRLTETLLIFGLRVHVDELNPLELLVHLDLHLLHENLPREHIEGHDVRPLLAHLRPVHTIFLHAPNRQGVRVSRPWNKRERREAVERIDLSHLDVHDCRLREPLVHERQLVRALPFVLVLVVHFRGDATGQEDPLVQMIGPQDGLVDGVARTGGAQRLADEVELTHPIDPTHLSPSVQHRDPKVVRVGDRPVLVRVLLPHGTEVQFVVLHRRPLPFHSLVGIAVALRDDEPGHDVRLLPSRLLEDLEHVPRPVVETQETVAVQGQFAQFHPPAGLVVLGYQLPSRLKLHGILSGDRIPFQNARQERRAELGLGRIRNARELIEVGHYRETEGVRVDYGVLGKEVAGVDGSSPVIEGGAANPSARVRPHPIGAQDEHERQEGRRRGDGSGVVPQYVLNATPKVRGRCGVRHRFRSHDARLSRGRCRPAHCVG
mmetsp:Transcript_38119/g.70335  ORF Transcript_38119/g.70335 Transcript_38119/m.70335 type:complete len:461 (+) Transcript_38119:351-1733(+)